MAENEWGSAVLATALAVVDDTSLTGKVLVGDIKVGYRLGHALGWLRWGRAGLSVCAC